MKFSIITPTMNSGRHIEKTIKSVISQENVDLEHIIIDSISKDNTIDILNKYKNKYDLITQSEEDEGISDAFNKGIKKSSGEWLVFLGSGDQFIHSNVLDDVRKEIIKRPSASLVWGNIIFINGNGEIGKSVSGRFPKKRLKRYMCMPHQATFTNKKLFEKFGLFDKNIKCAMDYDLLLRSFYEIDENNYIDYDVSYMLIGGISDLGQNAIRDFRKIQIKHSVWPTSICYLLFYWAIIKNFIKRIIFYNSNGFSSI